MRLRGYELVEELFYVDNSGFGVSDELALTIPYFEQKGKALLTEHGSLYTAITNAGQFQVYVGFFKKTGKSKSKKVANNTLEIDHGNGKSSIRLHDTDILTFENGKVTLDSGGWQTVTTKQRLNRFLPSGYRITQKNFEWFVNTPNGGKVAFSDGMTLAV